MYDGSPLDFIEETSYNNRKKTTEGGMDVEQTERITHMEEILNEALAAVEELDKALGRYEAVRSGIEELRGYYTSRQWMADFEDDRQGKLPPDLKRGVLSEDAVYNLLSDNDQLLERIRCAAGCTEKGKDERRGSL